MLIEPDEGLQEMTEIQLGSLRVLWRVLSALLFFRSHRNVFIFLDAWKARVEGIDVAPLTVDTTSDIPCIAFAFVKAIRF